MSDPAISAPASTPDLRLRPNPKPVLRLSRKVLVGFGLVVSAGIGGALMLAMQPQPARTVKPADQAYSTKSRPVSEQLNSLPKDYSGIPKLGPPLPGDLGTPILKAQQNDIASASPAGPPGTISPTANGQGQEAAQRLQQARDAAKTSQLFTSGPAAAGTPGAEQPATPANLAAPDLSALALPVQSQTRTAQDRQVAFVNQAPDRLTVSPERLTPPASPYLVQAGSVLPAALITGLRSDLPGQVTAQVSQNVYDSLTGQYLLIPQGSRLIGQYDNAVAFGQSRVLLAWTRLILPNGKSLILDKLSAADAQGLAGLEDRTDYHWAGMLNAAALSTILSVGAEAGSSDKDSDIVRALRQGASDSISRTGQQIVERQLNIQPALTIRPGFPVRVILSRDLILEPYGE